MKFKHFETESGNKIMVATLDGYAVGDRDLEGTTFLITIQEDGTMKAEIHPDDADYFSKFNEKKFLEDAVKLAEDWDEFGIDGSNEVCFPVLADGQTRPTKQAIPITMTKHKDLFNTPEEEVVVEEVEEKEPVIGTFTPKKEIKNFVVAKNNGVRLHTETALIEGKQLSGMLEDVTFKLTICDNGTVNFDEVDTDQCDEAMRGRLLEEIVERKTTSYAHKTVIPSLKFVTTEEHDSQRVYIEVETEEKPFDALQSLFNDVPEVSANAKSSLADLLGLDPDEKAELEETTKETVEEVEDEVVEDIEEEVTTEDEKPAKKSISQQMMEDALAEQKENTRLDLKKRVEQCLKDRQKHSFTKKTAETQLDKVEEDLEVLNTRLESMTPALDANGCVFYVGVEEKADIDTTDEKTIEIITKLAPMMKLNVPIVLEALSQGSYKIKIDHEDEDYTETDIVADDILRTVLSDLDTLGQVQMVGQNEFVYQGDMGWHQLVDKMIKLGFKQDPTYDEFCGSPSYKSNEVEEVDTTQPTGSTNTTGATQSTTGSTGTVPTPPSGPNIKEYDHDGAKLYVECEIPHIKECMDVRVALRDKLNDKEFDKSIDELSYKLPTIVENWPKTNCLEDPHSPASPSNGYMGFEDQDGENFEWGHIDGNEIGIYCGGDWQAPMSITIKADRDGKLYVTDYMTDIFGDGYSMETVKEKFSLKSIRNDKVDDVLNQ
jgi:hypothetical protein